MSLSKVSGYATFAALGGTFLWKLGQNYDNERLQQIRNLEATILGVATAQYGITNFVISDAKRIQRWRYLDWIVTTPLLLRTLYLLAEERGFDDSNSFQIAFGADLVMVTAGYLAEFSIIKAPTPEQQKMYDNLLFGLGFVAFGVILLQARRWLEFLKNDGIDVEYLEGFFYGGWTLYGLNFINPNEELRQTSFNVLDFLNKSVYSIQLRGIINNQFL